jgi:hypothetical protein
MRNDILFWGMSIVTIYSFFYLSEVIFASVFRAHTFVDSLIILNSSVETIGNKCSSTKLSKRIERLYVPLAVRVKTEGGNMFESGAYNKLWQRKTFTNNFVIMKLFLFALKIH